MFISKKLIFVLGKGGVGRSTLAASLGHQLASEGKKTLILQLSDLDQMNEFFPKKSKSSQAVRLLKENLYTTQHDHQKTIQEYFFDVFFPTSKHVI